MTGRSREGEEGSRGMVGHSPDKHPRGTWSFFDRAKDPFSAAWRVSGAPTVPALRAFWISGILLITAQKTGWNAASAHERDNPGNNMRTLSLSRTLSVDFHRRGLPEVRGSRAPPQGRLDAAAGIILWLSTCLIGARGGIPAERVLVLYACFCWEGVDPLNAAELLINSR